ARDQLRVLAIGDLTGDGTDDLVLAAPNADGGTGRVYVVPGGQSFSDVDLASPAITVFTIAGGAMGDELGQVAAIGQVDGSGTLDLVVTATEASPGGRSRAGEAYAFFGPITGDLSIAAAGEDVRWQGGESSEQFGRAVAIANVMGGTDSDVIFGASQFDRSPGVQAGGVLIWADAQSTGTTYDLNGGASADALFLGREPADLFGNVLIAAELTGDSFADIVASASSADGPSNGRDRAGEALGITGEMTPPAVTDMALKTPDFSVFGAAVRASLGSHPSSLAVGDFDNDGNTDLCVGSFRAGGGFGQVDCFSALSF
ncbi:MAG: FG-GAP repeat protein, partial [Myxococcota bacterium]